MKSIFRPVLLAGLLATAGVAAFSQVPAGGDWAGMMGAGGPMHDGMRYSRMGRMDPARMQAWMDKRQAELKALLKLAPAQEAAWTSYTAAMKPAADLIGNYPDFAEIAKLPTPERIDKMKALHNQRMSDMNALMDKRGEATKAFYATLTPEQQKVFDANTLPRRRHAGPWGGKGPGPARP